VRGLVGAQYGKRMFERFEPAAKIIELLERHSAVLILW
jgi:hypothetical protein